MDMLMTNPRPTTPRPEPKLENPLLGRGIEGLSQGCRHTLPPGATMSPVPQHGQNCVSDGVNGTPRTVLGRGLADVMVEAESDYARDSERIMTYQSDRITELETENATLRKQLSLTRDELITALKHLRGH